MQVPVRKFRGRSPRALAYLIELFLRLVCVGVLVGVSACACIGLCPSNATKAPPISTPTMSVEAPFLQLHAPLLEPKPFFSSWSLVVVYIRVVYGYPSVHGAVFWNRKSYGSVRCGFKNAEILRCGAVLWYILRCCSVRFWIVGNPTVQFGAVLENTVRFG